jgi:serine/threonine protein kinase
MEDQRMVQLALDNRMLTKEQVDRAKKEQQALADRGVERSLYFLLLDLGYMTDVQARVLRKYVSSVNVRALEVDGYVLQGRIGSGGMGDVFRAVNAAGQEAAVKLLSSKLAKNEENARRFQREARASMRLQHPHITQSLAAGEIEGQRYLVMELIKGPSLKQRMTERGKLPEDHAIILLWQMANALRYAWNHGVLHRDVKPANLMLAPPRPGVAEPFCAKICDFGLAKVMIHDGPVDEESKGMLTGAGMALGTPHYMPPEQASGQIDLDQRADIYSLAASVYHALLGQTMHHGKSSTIIMYKQVTESADLDALRNLGISDGMVKLMGRMLEKSRKRRLNTWDEVLDGVKTLAPGLVEIQEQALRMVGTSAADLVSPFALSSAQPASSPSSSVMPIPPRQNESTSQRTLPAVERASAPAPVISHPRGQAFGKRGRGWLILAALVLLVMAAAAGAWLILTGERGQRVSPATFAVVLAEVGKQDQRTLLLEPGDYPGPWRFTTAHVGVTIRALEPGVRVVGNGVARDVPLVRYESGLSDFTLAGIEIAHAGGVAVEAMAGARATTTGCTVSGGIESHGAHLVLRDLTLRGGVLLDLQGTVTLENSRVFNQPAISLHDGRFEVVRSRLIGGGPGAVVQALSGQLDLDAVVVDPETPADIGIDLRSGSSATMRDVAVHGVATGLHSDAARLPAINGLSVNASAIGWSWQGQRDPGWSWERVQLQAPKPVQGLEFPNGTEGARPERLEPIPAK